MKGKKTILVIFFLSLLNINLYGEETTSEEDIAKISSVDSKTGSVKKVALLTIMTFGAGLAVPLVLSTCSKKVSAWIFSASAGGFLASELLSSKEHKVESKKIAEEYRSLAGHRDKQIAALDNAAKASKESADRADKRSKRLKIVALGFFASSAAALAEVLWGGGACTGGGAEGGAMPNIHTNIFSLFFPMAHAKNKGMGKLIAPALGAGAFFLIKSKFPSVLNFLKKGINSGYGRAAIFGAFGAMALIASKLTKKGADTLRKRGDAYRELAYKMRSRFGIDAGNSVQLQATTTKYFTPNLKSAKTNTMSSSTDPCIVGKIGQYPRIDEECRCRQENNCSDTKIPYADFNSGDKQVNDTLNTASEILKNHNNALYNGKEKKGAVSPLTLSNSMASTNRLKKKLGKLINLQNKEKNKPPMDFKKLSTMAQNKLAKLTNNDWQKISPSGRAALASAIPTLSSSAGNLTVASKKEDKDKTSPPPPSPKLHQSEGSGSKKSNSMDLAFLQSDEPTSPANKEAEGEETKGEKKDVEMDSIHHQTGPSLWDRLHSRYIKLTPTYLYPSP